MRFVIATKNKHKQLEMKRILESINVDCVGDGEEGISLPEVDETGADFFENARLKAESAVRATGMPACADAAGVCVDALDGAPGLYSARFAGEGASDAEKVQKLLEVMKDETNRAAHFVSVICCAFPDGQLLFCEGRCDGEIAYRPDGEGGFGYDPVFVVEGGSFARLTPQQKDAVSHRGRALEKLSVELPLFIKEKYSC